MSLKFSLRIHPILRILLWTSLTILSCNSMAETQTITGPVELSTQEYKDLVINGSATLHAIKADSLTVNGPVDFIDLKVKGKTEVSGAFTGVDGEFGQVVVHGPFEGTKISADSLQMDGPVALEDFKIKGKVIISGPMKAKVGEFKDIEAVQTPIALYDVKVNNIHVTKDSGWVRPDNPKSEGYGENKEIKVAGKTAVSGNVTFDSGDGVVFIRDKTAQFKGKVTGGKIREN